MKTFKDVDLTEERIGECFDYVSDIVYNTVDTLHEEYDRVGFYHILSKKSYKEGCSECTVISFLGNDLWDLENDDRAYDDEDNPTCLAKHLLSKITTILDLLSNMNTSIVAKEET